MTIPGKTIKIIFISIIILAAMKINSYGQAPGPEILQTGTLQEQMDYIQNRTIIYENFRAIREDMFQNIKRSSLDSLANAKAELQQMDAILNNRSQEIDSLSALLNGTRNELNQAVENRDNIVFLGMPMNKMTYNLFVWVVIASLSFLLILGLLFFNKNRNSTAQALTELENLRKEFDEYKIATREKREKLVMEHFNEIKKLKEG